MLVDLGGKTKGTMQVPYLAAFKEASNSLSLQYFPHRLPNYRNESHTMTAFPLPRPLPAPHSLVFHPMILPLYETISPSLRTPNRTTVVILVSSIPERSYSGHDRAYKCYFNVITYSDKSLWTKSRWLRLLTVLQDCCQSVSFLLIGYWLIQVWMGRDGGQGERL